MTAQSKVPYPKEFLSISTPFDGCGGLESEVCGQYGVTTRFQKSAMPVIRKCFRTFGVMYFRISEFFVVESGGPSPESMCLSQCLCVRRVARDVHATDPRATIINGI